MEDKVKATLEKQLDLLSKWSDGTRNCKELCDLTKRMVEVSHLLIGVENQSFYGASTHHPYVVQLPVKDLTDLYAARAAYYCQSSPSSKI